MPITGTVSKTALMVTAYRARASQAANAICNDPWAEALAGADGFALAQRYDRMFPAMELWMAVRTRFLDDCVSFYVSQGFDQVVLLGAGFDTRSARLATEGIQFFEVDLPGSQSVKQQKIEELPGYPVDAATFVSCDFENQDFLTRLVEAGFDAKKRAVFVWEGVVCYLTRAAVLDVCKTVADGAHPESVLLFDYVGKAMAEAQQITEIDHEMLALLEELGEPVRYGTNDLLPLVYESGLKHLRTIRFDEACLSLTGTYDRRRRFRFQSMALASCTAGQSPWS